MDSRRKGQDGAADELAALADGLLGREEPERNVTDDLEVDRVVPAGVRNNPGFDIVTSGVATGSLGLAVVALIFGNGTCSAVVAGLSVAVKKSTTVGTYLTFGEAFILTLPLSILLTGVVWLALAGRLNSYGAVSACVLGALVITYLAGEWGIDGPTLEQMGMAIDQYSNPIVKGLAILGVYMSHYTVVPFLGGVITGAATGWIGFRLTNPA